MKIGVDIMGGDFAPEYTLQGSVLAREKLPNDVKLVLIGPAKTIESYLKQHSQSEGFEIIDATEVIEMDEHPSKAFVQKPNSTISVGLNLLGKGSIDGFASAGSTGAVMVGTMYTIKSILGIIRPCLASIVPLENGSHLILADVGITPDCRPDVLYQYAMLASKYAEYIYGIKNPKVGLLNIGSESEKGNLLAKATFDLMKDTEHFNFIGNVEGYDLLKIDKADVVICDGFVGNILLKQFEGFYNLLKNRHLTDDYIARFNFENYGGLPILGVNKVVIIGHGASSPKAIMNMLIHTYNVINSKLIEKLKETF
ncbi:MAG: phosphate acyltransferase PlsX [Bacteroidetes bacterium CG02_land_8_20_14_3_00_31_25]|nr:MAG: phosphate acyltransferase PlsX [Bacteroidetes bacterium CG02_land_8_20_14_3_00_31_25]